MTRNRMRHVLNLTNGWTSSAPVARHAEEHMLTASTGPQHLLRFSLAENLKPWPSSALHALVLKTAPFHAHFKGPQNCSFPLPISKVLKVAYFPCPTPHLLTQTLKSVPGIRPGGRHPDGGGGAGEQAAGPAGLPEGGGRQGPALAEAVGGPGPPAI